MVLTSAHRWIVASLAVWLVLSSALSSASSTAACCPTQEGNYSGAVSDHNTGAPAHDMRHYQHGHHQAHTPAPHPAGTDVPLQLISSTGDHTNTHLCDEQHQCSCTATVQPANINGAPIVSNHAMIVFHQPLIPKPASRPPTSPLRPPNLA